MTIKPTPTTYETIVADLAARVQALEAAQPGQPLDVADGSLDVDPTTQILVGPGLKLLNLVTDQAKIEVDTGMELMQSGGTLTIASGGPDAYISFAHQAGDGLMDYTTPSAPAFVDDGVYGVSVSVVLGQKVSAGKSVRGDLESILAHFSGVGPGDASQYIGDGTIASPLPFLSGTIVVQALAGDNILFLCGNDDTISHGYNVVSRSAVVKIS